mgnify:CR=1 FL=1
MTTAAPRHYGPALAGLAAPNLSGLPGDRQAHAAARRAFVDLKRTFMHALEPVPGVDWLKAQVRAVLQQAELLSDFWTDQTAPPSH